MDDKELLSKLTKKKAKEIPQTTVRSKSWVQFYIERGYYPEDPDDEDPDWPHDEHALEGEQNIY